jgi:hypothetical protein
MLKLFDNNKIGIDLDKVIAFYLETKNYLDGKPTESPALGHFFAHRYEQITNLTLLIADKFCVAIEKEFLFENKWSGYEYIDGKQVYKSGKTDGPGKEIYEELLRHFNASLK